MPPKLNLIGHIFGKLTVISETIRNGPTIKWNCVCSCGNTTISNTNNLRRGLSTSCGCVRAAKTIARNKQNSTHGMRSSKVYSIWVNLHTHKNIAKKWDANGKKFEKWCVQHGWEEGNKYSLKIPDKTKPVGPKNCKLVLRTPDLTGQKFGRLLVYAKSNKHNNGVLWECLCECGEPTLTNTRALQIGNTQSCGCLKTEAVVKRNKAQATHGLKKHPLYMTWYSMRTRCKNKNNKYYGARGITVCTEWDSNVVTFVVWMLANGWKKGMCLHRKDGDKGYGPENCELLSRSEHSTLHNNLLRNQVSS